MDNQARKDYSQYPLMLKASDVAQMLGISNSLAYQLMHHKDFPTVRIGKRLLVPRDKCLEWLEKQNAPVFIGTKKMSEVEETNDSARVQCESNKREKQGNQGERKRRPNGEGCFRKHSSGLWEITIMCGYKADGKRKTKSFYGKTEAEVKEKLAKYRMRSLPIEQRLDQECFFQEWADIWFENHKWRISKTTQDSYGYTLRTLKTYFENTRLRDIRPMDVEIMLRKMWEEGKSRSYLSSCRGMLFQIMNKAEANDLIAKNPVRLAEKIRYTNPVGRKDAFTSEEMEILMKKLPQNRIGWSIRLLLNTGMRTQELLALEPKHIALDGSSIRVYQAVKMEKGTAVVGETKNASSYREIPVPSYVRYCAVALRNTDKKYIWEAKKENQPCNPSYFRDQFSEALDSVPEVRKLTPHCCRHTYVSELIAHGVEVFTIQSLTGHTQMKMVAHYTHIRQKVREEAVEKLSETFGQA